jgi:hypothetical protein
MDFKRFPADKQNKKIKPVHQKRKTKLVIKQKFKMYLKSKKVYLL